MLLVSNPFNLSILLLLLRSTTSWCLLIVGDTTIFTVSVTDCFLIIIILGDAVFHVIVVVSVVVVVSFLVFVQEISYITHRLKDTRCL